MFLIFICGILIILLLGIGSAVFFICRRYLRKIIDNTQTRKITNWIATIILTPMVTLALLVLTIYIYDYYPNRDFNPKTWKTKSKRYEFSKRLIGSKLLLNKSKKDVNVLLGTPENSITADDWEYVLGVPPDITSLGFELALVVHFKNGKVDNVEQRYID